MLTAALLYLYCGYNLLTHLDVSNNTTIEYIDVYEMPSLTCVKVWVLPFPPEGVRVHTSNSPNVYYAIECNE